MATKNEKLSEALNEFLSSNQDLQINVDNISIITQTFVKTKTFLSLPPKIRGNILSEMHATQKLLYKIIIEQEKKRATRTSPN